MTGGLIAISVWLGQPCRGGEAAVTPPARIDLAARVAEQLDRAGGNRAELEQALAAAPDEDERYGLQFLIAHMPEPDLQSLSAKYLLANSSLAWQARRELPWGPAIPERIFLNDVLPYANIDEQRDDWRAEMHELCLPIVKDLRAPAAAAHRLNLELFRKLNLGYSTQRRAANQGPAESIASGKASCTGLSIVLADACRSVCIPARLVGTPLWANKRGNHTWVEIWDGGWHFTGACEADPQGLDRGWFVASAAEARADSFEHAIYAASFARTDVYFPLPWAIHNTSVPAENVTARYAVGEPRTGTAVRLLVRVVDAAGERVPRDVRVFRPGSAEPFCTGRSRGETSDRNDIVSFEVPPGEELSVRVDEITTSVRCAADRPETVLDVRVP